MTCFLLLFFFCHLDLVFVHVDLVSGCLKLSKILEEMCHNLSIKITFGKGCPLFVGEIISKQIY